MTDVVSAEVRSRMMSGIRGTNTRPELLIRSELHRRGFRFSLHRRDLPGNPDIVLPKYSAVIQIHGCFWHGHACGLFRLPKTRPDFWLDKIGRNVDRDERTDAALLLSGWRVLTVWECATRAMSRETLGGVISNWITSDSPEGHLGADGIGTHAAATAGDLRARARDADPRQAAG